MTLKCYFHLDYQKRKKEREVDEGWMTNPLVNSKKLKFAWLTFALILYIIIKGWKGTKRPLSIAILSRKQTTVLKKAWFFCISALQVCDAPVAGGFVCGEFVHLHVHQQNILSSLVVMGHQGCLLHMLANCNQVCSIGITLSMQKQLCFICKVYLIHCHPNEHK